ncbi:FAD-dependent monooxygenase [Nocardia sp. alder85J]|uniref:FAD-dependent monooxygenase n=1 Tax=Nocardia sp. alder85J TaxID=2862949 RepID=UPI001CD51982|nr:FAD-dependent monooxygenase [Nocardia sp. alder85J]MCX4096467.1 FAD-dependent monooxygenase [Nocardia sp. alder85J]
MTSVPRTPILVVGGGLVGLSTALLLDHHEVPYVLVERRGAASPLPRSRGLHVRTGEIYRRLALTERVDAAAAVALRAGRFGGAWTGETLSTATPFDFGPDGPGAAMGRGVPSPARFVFLPQVLLEPVLAATAAERGGDLRFGVELIDFEEGLDGVLATLRDATGAESRLFADHLIAADGAGSGIRRRLGIGGWKLPPTHHYLNVFAHVDLTGVLHGRSFSQCEIDGPVRGLVLSKNNTDEWSFHLEYDPIVSTPDDYPDEYCRELIAAMIGRSDLDIRILARAAWDTGAFVADDYRSGRVFLVGDAAHRHAPWGGFGGNTGVADAHNLVWKLAAALSGTAGPELLDSYTAERRPRALVAVEQSRLGTDFHTRYGLPNPDNADDLARKLDLDTVMSRYRYTPADREPVALHVDTLTGQTGTRVPHLWLDPDEELSTLDLCGPGFAVLVAGTGTPWRDAVSRAGRSTGVEIEVHYLPEQPWRESAGLPAGGALLVRPDLHVASRLDTADPDMLLAALRTALGAAIPARATLG